MVNVKLSFEDKVNVFLEEYEKTSDKESYIRQQRIFINQNSLPSSHPSEYMVWLNDFTLQEIAFNGFKLEQTEG
jgi:hypothetical protein